MLTKIISFSVSVMAIMLTSCTTAYYYPTRQNVIKFKEKGDANASLGLDANGYATYQAGYAITDHVALVSDYKTFHTYETSADGEYTVGDYFWDNEVIAYTRYQEHIYPAINVGYGFGQVDRNDTFARIQVYRQYVQPSLGFSNDYLDIAVSTRFTRVNHAVEQLKELTINPDIPFREQYGLGEVGQRPFYFLEPALTLGVGAKGFRIRYQVAVISKTSSGNIKYVDTNQFVSLEGRVNVNRLLTQRSHLE